jgi:hypothetical protein
MLTSAVKIDSDPICSSAGCTQYAHKKTPLGYPLDYAVPNYGKDPDIVGSANSLSIAEAMHAHKLEMGTIASRAKWHNVAKDTMYNFDPKLDEHILHSQKNLADTEDRLGHKWVIEAEPAYVPAHEKPAAAAAPEASNALQTQIDLRSDPICSSAVCTQYKHKATPLGYDLDYFVPSFGPDPDMVGTKNAISIAEAMHNHKIIMATKESRAKWHNVAKDVDYNFAPDLDSHIVDSQKNLADTEDKLGHKWVIEEDAAYTPYFLKPGFKA